MTINLYNIAKAYNLTNEGNIGKSNNVCVTSVSFDGRLLRKPVKMNFISSQTLSAD